MTLERESASAIWIVIDAALVGQPPGVAARPEPPEHAVEVAVVVDVQVGLPAERQLVAGLDDR